MLLLFLCKRNIGHKIEAPKSIKMGRRPNSTRLTKKRRENYARSWPIKEVQYIVQYLLRTFLYASDFCGRQTSRRFSISIVGFWLRLSHLNYYYYFTTFEMPRLREMKIKTKNSSTNIELIIILVILYIIIEYVESTIVTVSCFIKTL